jgi:hypothetical protein
MYVTHVPERRSSTGIGTAPYHKAGSRRISVRYDPSGGEHALGGGIAE